MSLTAASCLTLFAPLAGCLVIAAGGNRLPRAAAGWLATVAVFVAFLGALGALAQNPDGGELVNLYTWLSSGNFRVGFDLYIDALSIFEMLVVTGVGGLITAYSIGYMHGDDQERRFFAYMNLFVFAMLLLVMAGNFVFLLIGWGLVGMASYLLIGFWHHRTTAVAAAKKAFIMNAAGDVALMLGLFLLFVETGALTYPEVFGAAPQALGSDTGLAALAAALLLGGAITKSAQLPMHTWLPDAMEGPTPVSALIHAATMVTAGVYLVARMWPVFQLSDVVHDMVAVIGALTLLVAGLVALVQTDIKRVIAYSTMSQIGYMFVGVGVGAYTAGMFHLMTHAFFKALLFMAAGVVIHALAGEQDIRKMGGLKGRMPVTFALFAIASLALAGIIPFSGFFSKDEILAATFGAGSGVGYFVWIIGLVGVFLTALYTFRLLFLVFYGNEGPATAEYHPHGPGEGPRTMMVPVLVLGVLSAVGGLIAIPGLWNLPEEFLHEAVHAPEGFEHLAAGTAWLLALVSLAVAVVGIVVAHRIWKSGVWASWRQRSPRSERALQAALGFDAAYDAVLYRPACGLAKGIRSGVEGPVVAQSLELVSRGSRGGGGALSVLQGGVVRVYAWAMAFGLLAMLVYAIWRVG